MLARPVQLGDDVLVSVGANTSVVEPPPQMAAFHHFKRFEGCATSAPLLRAVSLPAQGLLVPFARGMGDPPVPPHPLRWPFELLELSPGSVEASDDLET